ncbi:MAG: tetratricopeptide repeat protein [Candidatus Krumholzibacteriota bacterium]|nr:tetratricopeptide repeat protein [Candidatus Krumholzibacteriota bacterium]
MRRPPWSRGRGLAGAPSRRRLALCALLALGLAAPAAAQDAPARREIPPDSARTRVEARVVPLSGTALARSLARLQLRLRDDPEQAREDLERLSEQHPEHHRVRLLLAQACRLTGDLDRSEALLRELLADYPEARGYQEELALTLFRGGRDDEALAILESFLDPAAPRAAEYEAVAELLREARRFERLAGLYERALGEVPPSDAPGRDRLLRRLLELHLTEDRPGDLLRLLAAELPKVEKPSQRRSLVRYAERLLAEAEGPRRLLPLADSLAATPAGPELAPALRGIYLAAGELEAFAARSVEAWREGGMGEDWLLSQIQRCLEVAPHRHGVGRRAARRILDAVLAEGQPAEAVEAQARYLRVAIGLEEDADARLAGEAADAGALADLRGEMALMRERLPSSPWTAEALVAELRLLRERLGRPAAADSLLRDWLLRPDRIRRQAVTWALDLEMGENLLALGQNDEARAHFAVLERTVAEPTVRGWARYRRAQLDALDGELAAAQDSLAALAKEDPAGILANDALDLALLLAESQMWPPSVRELIRRALAESVASRHAAAAGVLLAFAREFPDDAPAPALLYHAGLELERAYDGAAAEAWLALADGHPEDFRAPQALEKAARLALRTGDAAKARRLVARIYEEHPGSPLLPGLRDLEEALADADDETL